MGCSNYNFWKLDKWDKIGIASLIVFFTIFVVLNTFAISSSQVILYDTNSIVCIPGSSTILQSNYNRPGSYFSVIPGHTYKITISSIERPYDICCCLTSSVPTVGVEANDVKYLQSFTYVFTAGSDDYFFLVNTFIDDVNYLLSDNLVVEDITTSEFSASINLLSDFVSVANIWSVFNNSIPYILVIILVAFGIYLISHAIREISKGRDI